MVLEDKKPDFSNLPRGAIGLRGLPISRYTRLPSIHSRSNFNLGTPKNVYMPNIPVRREKKPPVSENIQQPKQENVVKFDKEKSSSQPNNRGRGRGRSRAQIIQTQGAIFSEGIAQNPLIRKDTSSPKSLQFPVFSEKLDESEPPFNADSEVTDNQFIDDDIMVLKPTIFSATAEMKKEPENFDPIIDISSPKLVLLQFPEFLSENQDSRCTSVKSLPEGYIGKLKVMKSGKVKLVIGSVELNLDSSDSFQYNHEVVSIRTDSSSGDLAVLGYLEQKLKFVPDIDSLLT